MNCFLIDVRFIEMMPIGYGRQYPLTHPGNPCGTRKALQKRVAAAHSGGKAGENPETDNSHTFKLGMAIALLSAIVYAAVSFANVAFISADMFTEQMNALMQQMAPMMDSNTMSQMDKTMQNLPQLTFFSNLIYCSIYGTLLSAILSRNIPDRNPFSDYKTE